MKPPKSSAELTFTGAEYLLYDIPVKDTRFAANYEDEFYLEFRTSRTNGLLAYAGLICILRLLGYL